MGLWEDAENAAGEVGKLRDALHSFLTDAGLGDVVRELSQLAHQANQLKQRLESAASSTKWTGSAASAFQRRARQREQEVASLVRALDSAHAAVEAAYAAAGIF